jgi:hypothetical protein
MDNPNPVSLTKIIKLRVEFLVLYLLFEEILKRKTIDKKFKIIHVMYDNLSHINMKFYLYFGLLFRAVERGGKAVNFYRGPGLKEARECKIYLILSHISLFWDLKNVKFLQILGLLLKSRGDFGARKKTKLNGGAWAKILPGPPILSTALGLFLCMSLSVLVSFLVSQGICLSPTHSNLYT